VSLLTLATRLFPAIKLLDVVGDVDDDAFAVGSADALPPPMMAAIGQPVPALPDMGHHC